MRYPAPLQSPTPAANAKDRLLRRRSHRTVATANTRAHICRQTASASLSTSAPSAAHFRPTPNMSAVTHAVRQSKTIPANSQTAIIAARPASSETTWPESSQPDRPAGPPSAVNARRQPTIDTG